MWAIASEPQFLHAIWYGTLALSLLSLAVLGILILRRISIQRAEVHQLKRRQEITRFLYAAIQSPVELNAASLITTTAGDSLLIMRVVLGMLRLLHGPDVARVVALLQLWKLQSYLETTAVRGSKGKRIQALTLLGYFSDAASLEILVAHAGHTDMYIQLAALRALALRGAVEHIDTIVEGLTRSQQTNTPMLADILKRFGEPGIPSLVTLTRAGGTLEVRIAALMALGFIGAMQAVPTLVELADDSQPEIRSHAIAALGRIGDLRAADAILAHLDDADAAVRVQAARALGEMKPLAALPKLAAHLVDDDWWVRFRAAEAMHHYGPTGVAALQAYSTRQGRDGIIAQQVLAELAEHS